ncbi:hypothetical protein TRIP_B360008 [uncultured Desulfatiglans sp.]|uniref:Uncharacterized protein n=1 Tax=Uncultured Desulfatiglans sp. TaxID=1748965 RepID=A0A653AD81_UNCDX|nr:hypothetical protein TRIP_B360008 [uncultured Desulfatiglans sp.]
MMRGKNHPVTRHIFRKIQNQRSTLTPWGDLGVMARERHAVSKPYASERKLGAAHREDRAGGQFNHGLAGLSGRSGGNRFSFSV